MIAHRKGSEIWLLVHIFFCHFLHRVTGTLGHFVDTSFGIGGILRLVQWQTGAAVVHDMNEEKLSVELIADVAR